LFRAIIISLLLFSGVYAQEKTKSKSLESPIKYKFNIMSHNKNFLLFAGHSSGQLIQKHWNEQGEENHSKNYLRDSNEAQFQLSIKIPLYYNFANSGADLFAAYTQNSYWQVYNTEHSSPFRETNYSPELFLEWQLNQKIANQQLKKMRLSFIHQSNGQDIGQSRSWNRTELLLLLQHQNILYGTNVWYRWDENKKENSSSTKGDDNPDLEKYIGKQKYFLKYENDNFGIEFSHQNNIFDYHKSRGNTTIDLILPSSSESFQFFVRYFNGYGESLIDYDVKVKRISFGIIIADWN